MLELTAKNNRKNPCCHEKFHGYPKTFTADNNPFNSKEMDEYATRCSFRIVHTRPLYSQSSGRAEKAVGIVKGIFGKGCDLNEALMVYRNTPISKFPIFPQSDDFKSPGAHQTASTPQCFSFSTSCS